MRNHDNYTSKADFSRGRQRLPGIECLPIWSTVVVSRPDSQLFNSWGKGMGCPLPSWLGDLGEHHKVPQWGPGRAPAEKRKTPDFTCPDFFHFPWLFPDHFGNSPTFRGFPWAYCYKCLSCLIPCHPVQICFFRYTAIICFWTVHIYNVDGD